MSKLGNLQTRMVLTFVASLGAVNWLAVEFMDTDLLSDTLGMSGDPYKLVIAVIGVAGAITLYNTGVWITGDR